jgi:hypothetical protein
MAQVNMLDSADLALPAVTVPLFLLMVFNRVAMSCTVMSVMACECSGPKYRGAVR